MAEYTENENPLNADRGTDGEDRVPVVRCKDCVHFKMHCFGSDKTPKPACCETDDDGTVRFASVTDRNGYCFRGKKRRQ